MTDTIAQSPTAAPTRLIYRSPSGRTEVAAQGSGHLAISVLRGKDDLNPAEGRRLAEAILAVSGEATVTIPGQTRAALTALGWTPPVDASQLTGESADPWTTQVAPAIETQLGLVLRLYDEAPAHRDDAHAALLGIASEAYRLGQESRTTATTPAGPAQL